MHNLEQTFILYTVHITQKLNGPRVSHACDMCNMGVVIAAQISTNHPQVKQHTRATRL